MPNFQTSKIYKLCSDIDDQIYVGSTTLTLRNRFTKHKYKSTLCPNIKVYRHFLNIGWNNVRIELIESFPCEDKRTLLGREQHHFNLLQPQLNSISAVESCTHGGKFNHCVRCNGAGICEHGTRRLRCRVCTPARCDICDRNYSGRSTLARHELSAKHLRNVLAALRI